MLICPVHKKEFRLGKYGYYCATKLEDGSWCKEKPESIDQAIEKAGQASEMTQELNEGKVDWDSKERRVIRQNSWRHATALVTANSGSLNEDLDTTFKQAQALAHQIEEDIYRE